MEELPLPSLSLIPMSKDKGAKLWISNSDPNPNSHRQCSIPIPIPIPIPVPVPVPVPVPIPIPTATTRYKPYDTDSCFLGLGPYGCGYQCVGPPQPQTQVKMNMNMNGFIPNKGEMDVIQAQMSVFGLVRRGTGVFHPRCPRSPTVQNKRSNRNKGKRNKKGAEGTQRSKNATKVNNGLAMKEECPAETPSDIGLPKEWTY